MVFFLNPPALKLLAALLTRVAPIFNATGLAFVPAVFLAGFLLARSPTFLAVTAGFTEDIFLAALGFTFLVALGFHFLTATFLAGFLAVERLAVLPLAAGFLALAADLLAMLAILQEAC